MRWKLKGESWSAEDEEAFKAPIREQYETQGHPYYATARLWDDGIVDPAQSRRVLGLSLSAALNAPARETQIRRVQDVRPKCSRRWKFSATAKSPPSG